MMRLESGKHSKIYQFFSLTVYFAKHLLDKTLQTPDSTLWSIIYLNEKLIESMQMVNEVVVIL